MRWLVAVLVFSAVMNGAPASAGVSEAPAEAGVPFVRGKIVDSIPSQTDPSQSYAYYLPAAYEPQSRWPILFVFDPRQRGAFAAELFRVSAELYGWIIVSSNNTHSDMSTEQNARALQAMWSDAPRRFSIDNRRIYAAGFSGGAIMAWWLGRATNMVAGIIGCGGRLNDRRDLEAVTFDWYGLVGDTDFNYSEMRQIARGLAQSNPPTSRLEVFPGAHRWPPPQRLREAIDWMEVQAIRRGARARDEEFLGSQLQKELVSARQLLTSEDLVGAMRAFENIDRTYAGLLDTTDARNRASELRKETAVRRALYDEQKAEELESSFRGNIPRLINAWVRSDERQPARALSSELRIAYLKKLARENSPAGRAAQRVLEMTFVQLSLLADDLVARRLSERATIVRQVAQEIR